VQVGIAGFSLYILLYSSFAEHLHYACFVVVVVVIKILTHMYAANGYLCC